MIAYVIKLNGQYLHACMLGEDLYYEWVDSIYKAITFGEREDAERTIEDEEISGAIIQTVKITVKDF